MSEENNDFTSLEVNPNSAPEATYADVGGPLERKRIGLRAKKSQAEVRSIKNISLNTSKRRIARQPSSTLRNKRKKNPFPIIVGSLFLLALLLVGGFALTSRFSEATVVITPKSINTSLEAYLDARDNLTDARVAEIEQSEGYPGLLASYSLLEFSATEERVVEATGEEEIEVKAAGEITIYNNFSEVPEKLVANTRFRSPSGGIYRIQQAVTVPAKSESGPGSVKAEVVADEPGEQYNLQGTMRFNIPGFESESDRYANMYGELSGGTVDGGFQGLSLSVDEADLASSIEQLEASLRANLIGKIASESPEGMILFEKTSRFKFRELPQENRDNSKVAVKLEGTLYAIMLNNSKMAEVLAEKEGLGEIDGVFEIVNSSNLSLTFVDIDDESVTADDLIQGILTRVSGTVAIEATINPSDIYKRVEGETRKSAERKLESSAAIDDADVTLSPSWAINIPADESRVTVISTKDEPEATPAE